MRAASILPFLCLLSLIGCESDVVDPGTGGEAGAGANGQGAGGEGLGGDGHGGDGQGGNGVQPPQGLFECAVPILCSMSFHTYPEPPESPNCIAELATSGLPGAVVTAMIPGPYYSRTETLLVYAGDGTAITQSRHKECMSCDTATLPWGEPSDIRICDVVIDPAIVAGCDANDEEACWAMADSTIENCQPVAADPTCRDISTILSAVGPACGDETCEQGLACVDYVTDMSTGTQCMTLPENCTDCACAVDLCTNPIAAQCEAVQGGLHLSNCFLAP